MTKRQTIPTLSTDSAIDAMQAAQAAHARAITERADEATLSRLYLAALVAERDAYAILGDAAYAEQIGYEIEHEMLAAKRAGF